MADTRIACYRLIPYNCLSSAGKCLTETNEAKWQASERDCRSKCHLKQASFFFEKSSSWLFRAPNQTSYRLKFIEKNPFAKYLLKHCNIGIVRDQGLFSCSSCTSIFPKLLSGARELKSVCLRCCFQKSTHCSPTSTKYQKVTKYLTSDENLLKWTEIKVPS